MPYRDRFCGHVFCDGETGHCLDPLCDKLIAGGPYRIAIRPPPKVPPRAAWWRLLRSVLFRFKPPRRGD